MDTRKLQIRLVPYAIDYKCVEYRIDPETQNIFKNMFNDWKPVMMYHGPVNENIDPTTFWFPLLVKSGTINQYKEKFKIMQDIIDFEKPHREEFNSAKIKYNEYNAIEY